MYISAMYRPIVYVDIAGRSSAIGSTIRTQCMGENGYFQFLCNAKISRTVNNHQQEVAYR